MFNMRGKKTDNTIMEKIVSLAKRRGFIFQSSEIYGGLNSFYDYGPLGVELKNNVKRLWWQTMVQKRDDIVGLDSAILMHPKVWEASGHLENFTDPLVDCKKCKKRFRADQIKNKNVCPECSGELSEERKFNMMFKTFMGPVEDNSAVVYLRPETAQGIFVNYKNVKDSMRLKLPFGIAQIGKAFRNEITPGNFTFRTREFEQAELEFFVKPPEADKWYKYWVQERLNWYTNFLGIKKENLRIRPHKKNELAHYAASCSDIEYNFPFSGWSELEGVANRKDFDLKRHEEYSGEDMGYFDEEKKEKYIPYIIEPSAGIDRTVLTILVDAYSEVEGGRTKTTKAVKEKEVVMKFHKSIAPIKVAVLPLLSNKKDLREKAQEIFKGLKNCYMSMLDPTGSIGRRYRRQDEIGTPFCTTVDFETLEKNTVTVRDRDTMKQERVKVKELLDYLFEKLK